jgi:glucose/arabinose dehydrogenase
MDRWLLLGVLSLLALLSAPAAADADPELPDDFAKVTVATGLWDPTAFAYAPDGRVFIVERRGRLMVARPGSQTVQPVLDITDHVAVDGDRGLLGVAVDADFETNRYVYLLYTHDTDPAHPQAAKTARLTRIVVNPDDSVGSLAEPGETVLLGSVTGAGCPAPANTVDCMPSDSNSHTIGTVRADPDGTLWVGNGDGASYATTDPTALRTFDEQSLAGKILHVDRQGRGLPGHAFCPGDANLDHVCTKLHAKGFRNPFRFQLRAGAGPIVGDVGWNTTEEVNLTAAGGSYGWPCWEGPNQTPGYKDLAGCAPHYATPSPDTPPAHFYSHASGGGEGAVVVGPQVVGTRYPAAYRNSWFLGDYVQGWLKLFDVVDGEVENVRTFSAAGFDGVDLELTPEGDLAYLRYSDGTFQSGRLERIVHGNAPPPAVAHADPASGSAPLSVDFSADESIDPDGDLVTYTWDFGDGTPDATGRTATHVYDDAGVYDATLTVRDARGLESVDEVQVLVDESPPVAAIEAPAAGALFRHGTAVALRGSATDADEGELGDAQLSWNVLLYHGTHIHNAVTDLPGAEQSFTPPGDHDADSYYAIQLTATDETGLTDTEIVEIHPETVALTLASSPPGVTLSYSGSERLAPALLTAAIGYHTTISAPAEIVTDGGVTRRFEAWSDGGARQHDIVVPAADSTLTARYAAAPTPTPTPTPSPTAPPPPPPAGGGPAPPPTAAPPPAKPRLRLDRARRRARVLRGTVTGLATAPRVKLALRTARAGTRCRHWHARRAGLGKRAARCSSHVWLRAAVTPAGASKWRFRVRLRGALRRGRYVVAARVTNARGRALIAPARFRLRMR